ncbi:MULTISPECIES: NAD(P)H-dependent oxidoreductase [Raoultella]|jgi:glutathione-regulated potassium-efflux system ancillary protein KefF|uniref:NAD(P)H-dependent oxidoreductase n=1 Tax=Raoultella TaxID=160674 RepID=UPI0009769E33|nr:MULTISPECIES: NAD(P)H-dependent oxidoreductase [Raoultella]MCS4270091.1 glutathione-regulated potassium-efflux system ancillary protein KefF [Raoultella sp. BIGb0132]MCS4287051.1 glutathione-regulated potassium-efflux system ancillary protein KefF [Raoultella terrigena]OMP97013.1 MdaB protein [Raoultella terrigena]
MNWIHLRRAVEFCLILVIIGLFPVSHALSREKTDIKTLVIVSHPYPERSVLTKGLQEAAESIAGVTVRNLETLYGFDTRNINGETEREMMREHTRIVFMFPTHWFNITPMMKAWLNETWGSVGPGLWQGKEMMVVSTAAGGASTYGPDGRIGVTLADVFLPMKASALHAGMTWLPPLVFEGASSSQLPEYQRQLIERLKQ